MSQVPEPDSCLLAGLALVGLVVFDGKPMSVRRHNEQ